MQNHDCKLLEHKLLDTQNAKSKYKVGGKIIILNSRLSGSCPMSDLLIEIAAENIKIGTLDKAKSA